MHKRILPTAFAVLAVLAITSEPAEAGQPGWSAGHWSMPAGARFSMSSPGVRFHTGAFAARRFENGVFFGGRPGGHLHGPVFVTPFSRQPVFVVPNFSSRPVFVTPFSSRPVFVTPFSSQPVFVVRNMGDRGFGSRSAFGVRQFDPVSRTVVRVRLGG